MAWPIITNSLNFYLAQINRFPILTPEEEFQLAEKYWKYKDIEAAHKLVTSNLRFVVKIAFEYRGFGVKLLDLIQEGNLGLMKAVQKFDPYKGYRLISYAVWWIRAYIQNFIIKSWSLVKLGTTQAQKKLFYKLKKVKGMLESKEMECSPEILAQNLNVKTKDIEEMEARLSSRDFSLDTEVDEEGHLTHLDLISDESFNPEESLAVFEKEIHLKEEIREALRLLNEREQYLVENRVMADEPLTLREIGDKFHISRERVRQIEKGALKKIKGILAEKMVD